MCTANTRYLIQAKPTIDVDENTDGDKNYLTLLRGLVLPQLSNQQMPPSHTPAPVPIASVPAVPVPVPIAVAAGVPVKAGQVQVNQPVPQGIVAPQVSLPVPGAAVHLWTGSLSWSASQPGKPAPLLALTAQAPAGSDIAA